MNKVILTADSTCDIGDTLKEKYNVQYFPFTVIVDGEEKKDSVNITPDEIYSTYVQKKTLPKTAASSPKEYQDFFQPFLDQGYEVVHISLGSALSMAHQNADKAAQEMEGVYVIDSHNLSTGIGILVLEAADRVQQGKSAAQIKEEVEALRTQSQASFIVDTLEYLHAGGRCSSLALLGTNLLNIHPCIEVDNTSGNMNVGKKYMGSLDKVLRQYTKDKIKQFPELDTRRIFITHSGISQERIELVKNMLEKAHDFEDIYITRAGCTISSHCGPNTLGVLFLSK